MGTQESQPTLPGIKAGERWPSMEENTFSHKVFSKLVPFIEEDFFFFSLHRMFFQFALSILLAIPSLGSENHLIN